MKKHILIGAGILSIVMMLGIYRLKSVDGIPIRWRDYLPSRSTMYCHLTNALTSAARAYQQAVLSSLSLMGDAEAIRAWRTLMEEHSISELLCMMGGQSIEQIAIGLTAILPNIPGLSWAARQALSTALYNALEQVRGAIGL